MLRQESGADNSATPVRSVPSQQIYLGTRGLRREPANECLPSPDCSFRVAPTPRERAPQLAGQGEPESRATRNSFLGKARLRAPCRPRTDHYFSPRRPEARGAVPRPLPCPLTARRPGQASPPPPMAMGGRRQLGTCRKAVTNASDKDSAWPGTSRPTRPGKEQQHPRTPGGVLRPA